MALRRNTLVKTDGADKAIVRFALLGSWLDSAPREGVD